ncbi:MAG: TatD family hydrolase [Desulfopila sp.]|nr:TatD family hydrolase [Desulfopila sp.]
MQLIDTHSHIDLHSFTHDRKDVLQRCRKNGVVAQILPGVSRDGWENLLRLCCRETDLFAAPGLHPMYLPSHLPEHLEELREHIRSGEVVALGEIGLDFYVENLDHKEQQHLFEQQLLLAMEFNLPILIHARKAHDQVQAALRRRRFQCGGIVHAFSGSLQQAEKYIGLGFKIGFGGTLTYSRATRIRTVAQTLPLEEIVLETDAPDIPPACRHGERNSPEYLPLILDALSQIRPESKAELAYVTTANAISVLRLDTRPDFIAIGEKKDSHLSPNFS